MSAMTELRQAIAGELRAALADDGRSQAQLSRASGVSRAALSRKLRGDNSVSVEELLRLARALGVSPASVIGQRGGVA